MKHDSFSKTRQYEIVWTQINSNQRVDRIDQQEELTSAIQELTENSEEIHLADIPDLNDDNSESTFHMTAGIAHKNNQRPTFRMVTFSN